MNNNLPIFEKKNAIINAVSNNEITIITAETGSGKSTQVPQYLYEEGYEVIVTQPRRIACVSLANRVSDEMKEKSFAVGYHTAFESNRTKDTKILFCTDGLQMAKAVSNSENAKNGKTVLIIDEVHEWNLNIETLIAWIKNEKKVYGSMLKVVLMSATVDVEELYRYFAEVCSVAMIDVPNRAFSVNWHMENSDFAAIESTISCVKQGKNVLVFQPGKKEINDCINAINDQLSILGISAKVLPMHGELTIEDQKAAFAHYNVPKVVVATNIAQTSITINDIDAVVDTGSEKVIEVVDGIEGLYLKPISQADCVQRAGRAGRVKSGDYYLCSDISFDEREKFTSPEICRLFLDKVILKLLSIGLDAETLEFFHQPAKESLIKSKSSLKTLGALDSNGNITDIGKQMVKMPVSSRCARMIIEADRLNVLDDMLTIISVIETGSLVNFKAQMVEESFLGSYSVNVNYRNFVTESDSDLLAELQIYRNILDHRYNNLKEIGVNVKNFRKIKAFRDKLSFSISNMFEIREGSHLKNDIISAIFSGMVENLCEKTFGNEVENIYGDTLNISKNSCVSWHQFYFGFPITIEFNDRFGNSHTKNILQFVSRVDVNTILDYVDESALSYSYDVEDCDHLPNAEKFLIDKVVKFHSFELDRNETIVSKAENPDEYAEILKSYSKIPKCDRKERFVEVNGMVKRIHTTWNCIDLTFDELMSLPEDLEMIQTPSGKYVRVSCCNLEYLNVKNLKKEIISNKTEERIEKFKNSLPAKTGKLESIVGWFNMLGEKKLNVYGSDICFYVGLSKNKGSIEVSLFNTKEESDASTKECLEFLVMREVNSKYQDKKFKVLTNEGKKIETKSSIKMKNYFHENVRLVLDEVDVDNFEDDLAFIDEVFNECMAELA